MMKEEIMATLEKSATERMQPAEKPRSNADEALRKKLSGLFCGGEVPSISYRSIRSGERVSYSDPLSSLNYCYSYIFYCNKLFLLVQENFVNWLGAI